jgi:hypothetical protein
VSQWLLNRLQEESKEPLVPQFAFQGAINWLRALSLIIEKSSTDKSQTEELYLETPTRSRNHGMDTAVFESIHFAYQNVASLNALNTDVEFKYDICNSAIVCWHDAIVFSAKAMVLGFYEDNPNMNGTDEIVKLWQDSIVVSNLIPAPFDLFLPTLVKKESDSIIQGYRGENSYTLDCTIQNEAMALGGLLSYLNGTHGYELWKSETKIKKSEGFRILGVHNFRTNRAKEFRDSILSQGFVNFLVQAERFRGKSNYRDSIFLSYGENNTEKLSTFINDLLIVSKAFLKCASIYCSKRVEPGTWDLFVNDIEENTCLSVEIDIIKNN